MDLNETSSGDDSRSGLRRNGKKGLGCNKKTAHVILCDCETVINPLPGYD
jgi:hypothetical protein